MATTTRTRRPSVPRPPPPPIPPEDLDRLTQLLEAAPWQFARTMPHNPHHYTLRRKWVRDEDFVFAVSTIRRFGQREKYKKAYYTTFTLGEYFYFTLGWPINTKTGQPLTILINKKSVALRGIEAPPRLRKKGS